MAAPVVHFEIISAKHQAPFYERLFGWQANSDNPMGYGTVSAEQAGLSGGLGRPYEDPANSPAYATIYVAVPDIDATLEKAVQEGGKVALSRRAFFPGGPTIAQLTDPAGVRIGLLEQPPAS